MNNTDVTVYFANLEKGFLPVVFVPCAVLCLLVYKFAKRPLSRQDDETMARRMQYLYSMGSAILLGEVLFHVVPYLTQPFPAVVGLGYIIAIYVERILPRLSRNSFLPSNNLVSSQIELEHSVDFENVKLQDRLIVDDCLDEDYAEQATDMAEEEFELKKRRVIVTVFVLTLLPFVIFDGFYFASFAAPTPVLQIIAFYMDKLLQTLALCVMLVHAYLHGVKSGQWPWYLIICIVWCLLCGLSTLPVELEYNFVTEAVPTVVINFFYSALCGILLWMASYLNNLVQHQQEKYSDKRSTYLRFASFAAVFALSALITVFI